MKRIRFTFSFFIALLLISSCHNRGIKLTKTEYSTIELNSASSIDSTILKIIYPYKTTLDKEMNEVIGTSEVEMNKGIPESLLGNLISDLLLKKANDYLKLKQDSLVDMALFANGGLRTSLPKGPITKGKIYEILPFENTLVIVTLSGTKMNELFQYLIEIKGAPVSGMKLLFKDKTFIQANINGKTFDMNKKYRIATSDYHANGGDNMSFLLNPIAIENTGIKLRDAVIELIKTETQNGKMLTSRLDQRIDENK